MRKAFLYILLIICFLQVKGQSQSISGTVNSYYKATQVYATYIQMDAGEDLNSLQPGDKIVLMQMSGVQFDTTAQTYTFFENAGHYEMLSVKSVNNVTKRIEPTVTLDPAFYGTGEKLQVVKIFETDYATVTGTLTAKDWDGETGGVIALVIFKKLILNANIEANSTGFRGAEPVTDYTYGCNSESFYYYPTGTTDKAGRKGGSCIINAWAYQIGPGRAVTGGGGGIGKFAGGGGGGHIGSGGSGGQQMAPCLTSVFANGGQGINGAGTFYNTGRVTMGGGGGSSTENTDTLATKGGDGGGIIIIIADTLENAGGSFQIQSRGESVNATAMAGGGGGGAGGAILLDINVYKNDLTVDVSGGKGGDTGDPYAGAGGGGGGGTIVHTGTTMPPITPIVSRGNGGESESVEIDYQGGPGNPGSLVDSLELPLNGFLFNSLTGTDTVCQGVAPNTIRGSVPKGSISYTYEWIQSTDSINWGGAVGSAGNLEFTPFALYQTTWFNRVVISFEGIRDTALPVKVWVWDSISGNVLDIRDTLCYNDSPGTLLGDTIKNGGNGIYEYLWESSINQSSWSNRGTDSSLIESNLTQTTYYRRTVTTAKVCTSVSNIDTLTVLPLIDTNGFLRTDTAICEGLNGGLIRASVPEGGDGTYSYSWLVSDDDVSYSIIGGANGQNHGAGILSTDKYYKRVVYSGSDDACRDTTVAFPITVYPSIAGDSIFTDSSRYCAGDIPEIIIGNTPSGGDEPNYTYSWWKRILSGTWELISGETGLSYTPSAIFEDSVEIRREVISGNYGACKDESNILQLDVIPYIINTLASEDETVCEEALPVSFTETAATGGAGGYEYLWQVTPVGTDDWQPASEDITANNLVSYSSPGLNTSSLYRRRVISQICTSYSDTITITVYPLIENNFFTQGSIQYTCYNSIKEVLAEEAGGGNGTYAYFWEESPDESSWSDATGANSEQNYTSPPLTDTIFYRRIVHSGETAQCKDTADAVLIRINPLPTGDIISKIDTVCEGDSRTIAYEGLTGTSPWLITIGESSDLFTTQLLSDAEGDFEFDATSGTDLTTLNLMMRDLSDANGCHSALESNTGLVELTIRKVPSAIAGENDSVCGPEYTFAAVPSIGTGAWSGTDGSFSDANNPEATVTITNYGEYTFTWTETNWQCPDADEVVIIFYELPAQPNAGEDFHLDNKYQATLDADVPLFGVGYWQFINGSGSFVDNDSLSNNATARFDGPGEYTLSWSVVNGVCEPVSDEIQVSINDLELFTGFSPNGDGVNDDFILILSGEKHAELIIFDQWGGIVYQNKEQNAEEFRWNGELNGSGNPVPEGTYFYVLKEDGEIVAKNYVELRR